MSTKLQQNLDWQFNSYSNFTLATWEQVLKIRQDVFIVEQQSIYPDIDGIDKDCLHLCVYDEQNQLIGYARILPPGLKYSQVGIGRILISESGRGTGLGRKLVEYCIKQIALTFPQKDMKLSAQVHLQAFYQSFGFEVQGEPYDDGGIDHVDMVKTNN